MDSGGSVVGELHSDTITHAPPAARLTMSNSPALILIAPRIATAILRAIANGDSGWPQLARVAGRGSVVERSGHSDALRPWQGALLEAVGIGEGAGARQYPGAATTRTGDVGARAEGFWMQALPMHFSAGLDRLTAATLDGEGALTAAERAELATVVAAHLRTSGYGFYETAEGEWLVHGSRALEVRTSSPESAKSGLDDAMPRGADAAQLKRLMTELQMLLHEHPVSVHRVRRGLPECNAVWFHGAGEIPSLPARALPDAYGDVAYLRGVYRLHDQSVGALPASASGLPRRLRRDALVVIESTDLDSLEKLWVAPLLALLAAGGVRRIELILDRWTLTLARSALLKVWRRACAPAQWASC
jgi:hypothetical protein